MRKSMDSSVGIRRGLKRGLLLLKRERTWGATLTLLSAVLVLVQLFVVMLLSVYGVNRLLSSQAALRLEAIADAPDQDIQTFFAAVHAHPDVGSVSFVTKEQAYNEQRKRDPDLAAFLDQYQLENPFPDTFVVTLKSLDAYDSFRQFIEQDQWQSVINPTFLSTVNTQERQIRDLLSVTAAIRSVTYIFMFVAFAVLLFVVLELVSRTVRTHGDELFVENMLGASPIGVLLPFIAEMTILLLAGTIIATAIVGSLMTLLPFLMPALAMEAPFRAFATEVRPLLLFVFPWIVLLELCLMPAIAYIGTFLGAGRKLLSPVAFFS
ncbi:permease-like cell division protein FtsX [Candidatus Peribacteria bacterium]|nr:MAG: permease-like cell division protein FtsX [Candidatus Peribacteria bacterium]